MNRKKKQLDSNCRPAGFFGMLYLCNRSPTLSNKPMTSKNTIVIATGTTYLMTRNQRANSWFRFVDPTLISRNNVSLGILVKVKTAIANAPKGIKIFETIESRKSKIVWPNMVTSLNNPKDKADGTPTRKMRIPVIQVTFFRLDGSFLVIDATIISNIENAEVKVANKNNNKKISKKNAPNGILLNTAGSTTNKSPGPSVGSKPKEKTAGKIANPAKREMIIFIVTIVKADLVRSSFLDK